MTSLRCVVIASAPWLLGCAFDSAGLGSGSGSGPVSAGEPTTGTTDAPTTAASATDSSSDPSAPSTSNSDPSDPSDPSDSGTTVVDSGETDVSAGETTSSSGGESSPCDVDNGGCHANAGCTVIDGSVKCECNDGFVGTGLACVTAPSFEMLRVELPCLAHDMCGGPPTCTTEMADDDSEAVGGDDGVDYEVTLRIRGVVEPTTYANGRCDGAWCVGGTAIGAPWNEFTLESEDPVIRYHLNQGEAGSLELFVIDEMRTITVPGGTTLSLRIDGNGTCSVNNDQELVVPNVEPAPSPFDGQFVQVDLVSAAIAP